MGRGRTGPAALAVGLQACALSGSRSPFANLFLQRRAGLKETGQLHILRHTFCSRLAMAGASTMAIKELAGNQQISTTQRYMHLSPAAKSAAIQLLDRGADLPAPQDLKGPAKRGDVVETDAPPPQNPSNFSLDDWSGRQDLNLRPPGPERSAEESHIVSSAGTASQPSEDTGNGAAADSHGVAQSRYVETPFGAPVVRDLSADPGPHERLMTAREVAARLGVCRALVYRLCQRNELLAFRIGGALRFHREAVESFLARR